MTGQLGAGPMQTREGASPIDRNKRTLDVLFKHPAAHDLHWADVITLFESVGTVKVSEHKVAFQTGSEHHTVHKTHSKHLTTSELVDLRHFASAVGLKPTPSSEHTVSPSPSFLILVDHHDAKIYHVDLGPVEISKHTIKPADPHRLVRPSDKEERLKQDVETDVDERFFERIAAAVSPGGRVVVVGNRSGHNHTAHHLAKYLETHQSARGQHVSREEVADIHSLSSPEMLELGRQALGHESLAIGQSAKAT